MGTITLVIAIIGCLLVFSSRPVHGLAAYIILSIWYPFCIGTVSIGTIDFSVGRIVIIALFAKIFFNTDLATKFKVVWLDRLVVILFVAEVVAGLTTIEPMQLIENRSGDFFDMALPYFAVRLIITSKEQYISLLKAIAWAVAGLSLFAFYESLTGHNLLRFGRLAIVSEIRRGFFRASTTFRHPIYFGVFSAMTGAACMGLVKSTRKNAFLYKVLIGLIFLGVFSSMSSGGILAAVGALLCIGFYKFRFHWKGAIIGVILVCGLVEVISNRHFYEVIGRFTFSSSTAWYRGRLIEVALFEGGMSGHWITGYGFDDPLISWGAKIDHRDHTDMVNHYLLELYRYGLVGFIPFCMVIIAAIKRLFEGFWSVTSDSDSWLVWCLGGGLLGVLLAFNSVSLFGTPMIMLFMMFGFCVMIPQIIDRRNPPSKGDYVQGN